jgi:hypothetical protein
MSSPEASLYVAAIDRLAKQVGRIADAVAATVPAPAGAKAATVTKGAPPRQGSVAPGPVPDAFRSLLLASEAVLESVGSRYGRADLPLPVLNAVGTLSLSVNLCHRFLEGSTTP